ncbi:hypothetical protein F8M41_014266 [Gigaspora margarita]|uniref:Uncharacterized protein n=1 Tax=Gigaspora margarita TaxID=4874 RepID=A0A8H4EP17_GIGMA|nr:hypothetical protein F8M41_014266 [Gigaspora margarita]
MAQTDINDSYKMSFHKGLQVPPPRNSVLRNTTTNRNVQYRRNEFLISWICNYSFLRNGFEMFRLERQKQQAISGDSDLRTSLIEH